MSYTHHIDGRMAGTFAGAVHGLVEGGLWLATASLPFAFAASALLTR